MLTTVVFESLFTFLLIIACVLFSFLLLFVPPWVLFAIFVIIFSVGCWLNCIPSPIYENIHESNVTTVPMTSYHNDYASFIYAPTKSTVFAPTQSVLPPPIVQPAPKQSHNLEYRSRQFSLPSTCTTKPLPPITSAARPAYSYLNRASTVASTFIPLPQRYYDVDELSESLSQMSISKDSYKTLTVVDVLSGFTNLFFLGGNPSSLKACFCNGTGKTSSGSCSCLGHVCSGVSCACYRRTYNIKFDNKSRVGYFLRRLYGPLDYYRLVEAASSWFVTTFYDSQYIKEQADRNQLQDNVIICQH